MNLSIILATRGRPQLLARTLETTLANITEGTRIFVAIDEDDKTTTDALTPSFIGRLGAPGVTFAVRPRAPSLGEKYNQLLPMAKADAYLVMVDYAPHVTKGFDQKILDAASIYPDGYAIVYNRHANLSFPGINAVTHKMMQAMGGIYPGFYPYWFVDHHLDDIAQMTGRTVFADVEIDTSVRKEEPGKPWTHGRRDTWLWALLFDVLSGERQAIARHIIDAADFADTPARKRALHNNMPMIVHHSMMVNSGARQMAGEDRSVDAWYAGVRAKGLAKLRTVLPPDVMTQVETEIDRLERLSPAA